MSNENVKNYREQSGSGGNNVQHFNGDVAQGPAATEQTLIHRIGIGTPTAGAANTATVLFSALNQNGDVIARNHVFDIFLSDDSGGVDITATAASGTVGAGTKGKVIGTLTTKKMLRVQTDADGTFQLTITDTAKTQLYLAAINPFSGLVYVGADRLTTARYG